MEKLTRSVAEASQTDQLLLHRRTQALWYLLGALSQAPRHDWTPEQAGDWLFDMRRSAGVYRSYADRWGAGNPWAVAHPFLTRLEVFSHILQCQVGSEWVMVRHSLHPPRPDALSPQFGLTTELSRLARHYGGLVGRELGVSLNWGGDGEVQTIRFTSGHPGAAHSHQPEWYPAGSKILADRARREVARSLATLIALGWHFNHPPERIGRALSVRIGPRLLGQEAMTPWPDPAMELAALTAKLHLGLADTVQVQEQSGGWEVDSGQIPPADLGLLESYGVHPSHVSRFFNGLLDTLASHLGARAACEAGRHVFVTTIHGQTRGL